MSKALVVAVALVAREFTKLGKIPVGALSLMLFNQVIAEEVMSIKLLAVRARF